MKPVDVLMIEDNRGDVVLVDEAMSKAGLPHHLDVARDGVEAMEYLRRQGRHEGATRPDLIILDLKLPRKMGREVLEEIRTDPALEEIPLVILSSSRSELGLARSAHLPEGSYNLKPYTFAGYVELVQSIEALRLKARRERDGGDRG